MSSSPPVIVVTPHGDAEARASRQLLLGFARDGVPATAVVSDGGELTLPTDDVGVVVIHGSTPAAVELVREVRVKLDAAGRDVCVVFAGSATGPAARTLRRDAEAAGAHEVIQFPAYLRDVVTVARVLRGHPASKRDHVVGNLAETTGVFTLVRALASLGRSAVLTLMRGLRRGEIRFFHGEVTSAELAITHGQAALHQLLLWTEARFEILHEDVVRRHQIPLTHDELFDDAERFLENVREASGSLSPAMVLEQDVARIQSLGKQVPTEVHGILRMFDGHRVLADIMEDSPYRVFETLRVTQRAVEVGLLRVLENQKPKATWRTVLAIEEWLTGHDRDAAVEKAHAELESGPVRVTTTEQTNPTPRSRMRLERSRITRNKATSDAPPVARTSSREIDWGSLVPRVVGAEVGSLSGVVPAAQLSGEIALPTREEPRERLEAMMDTAQREKIFVLDQAIDTVAAKIADEKAAAEARIAALEAEAKAREAVILEEEAARAKAEADARAKADAEAKAKAEAEARAKADAEAKSKAEADAKAKADADAKTKVDAEAEAKAKAEEAARANADAEAKSKAEADAKAKADADAKAKTDAEAKAKAKAKAEVEARAKADAQAEAEADARAKADAEAKAKADADADAKAKTDAEAEAKAKADAQAEADADARAKADAEAKAKADADARAKTDANAKAKTDAKAKAKAEVEARAKADAQAEAEADARAKADAEAKAKAEAEARAKADAEAKSKADADAKAKAEEEARAKADVEAKSKAAADAKAKADADAKANADAESEAKAKADADANAKADEAARAKADVEAKSKAETDAKAKADADAKATTDAEAKAKADAGAAASATVGANAAPDVDPPPHETTGARRKREREEAEDAELRAEASALAKRLKARTTSDNFGKEALQAVARVAETPAPEPIPVAVPASTASARTPDPDPSVDEDEQWKQVAERARAAARDQMTMPVPRLDASEVELPREVMTPPVVVAETSTQTVTLREALTVAGTAQTAVVTSTPVTTVHSTPPPDAAPPEEIDDEPSDGIVRAIPVSDHKIVAPLRRAPTDDVPDDRPEDATGEITMPIEIVETPPMAVEPTILVDDLAAAHSAVAAMATQQAAPPPAAPNLATSQFEKVAGAVRGDASLALSEAEEAFFKKGAKEERANLGIRTGAVEKFDDLDDDYQPLGFWDRLRGKKPEK